MVGSPGAEAPKLLEVISEVANEPAPLLLAPNDGRALRDVADQVVIHRRNALVDTTPDLLDCVTRHAQRLGDLFVALVHYRPSEDTLFGR